MRKLCMFCKSLIGDSFPFFLGNANLAESYYQYQITTPGLSENCVPMITLEKVSERFGGTGNYYGAAENNMWNSDIIATILRSRRGVEKRGPEYIGNLLDKEEPAVYSNGTGFPLVEMKNNNSVQKLLIIGLRDSLRWRNYKFTPGNYVDVLYGNKTFIVFKIEGNETEIWLSPVSLHDINDCNLNNPLPIPDLSNFGLTGKKWSGDKRASDINRDIRKVEWEYFNEK